MVHVEDGKYTRVLLYGLGAIGSVYAFIFSKVPRVHLTVVARSSYEEVKLNGFIIDSSVHGEQHVRPDAVLRFPSEVAGHYDFVVCCHKAIDQGEDAKSLSPVIDDATTVVLLQNGVGNEDPFRDVYPKITILSGCVWIAAVQTAPGKIRHIRGDRTEIGLYPNPSLDAELEHQRLTAFVELFKPVKSTINVQPNIQVQRWEKIIWNLAWNPITTLTGTNTVEWLYSSPEAIPMTRRLMCEAIEVALKSGVPLDEDLADRLIERKIGMGGLPTSMQTDAMHGRPMEIDCIVGVPVKKGRELGVAIPTMEMINALILGVAARVKQEQR